VLLTGTIG